MSDSRRMTDLRNRRWPEEARSDEISPLPSWNLIAEMATPVR
jgi:hypothetical protein